MAADAKRGVDPRALCGVFRQFLDDTTLTVDWLRRALSAQGLHVVTAAEKAVLKAMAKAPYDIVDTWAGGVRDKSWISELGWAELARREAEK